MRDWIFDGGMKTHVLKARTVVCSNVPHWCETVLFVFALFLLSHHPVTLGRRAKKKKRPKVNKVYFSTAVGSCLLITNQKNSGSGRGLGSRYRIPAKLL